MSKKIEKKSDSKKESTGRGRPSTKTDKEKPKKESKKKSEEETTEDYSASMIAQIYGNEIPKNVTPFPNSELQTQAKNIINEFAIDVVRLPQNIVDAVNALIGDFSYFVQNPNMTNMIPSIMDKDLICLNLMKEWVEPRRALLVEFKAKTQGGVIVKTAENNLPAVQNQNPNPKTSVTVRNNQNQNQNPNPQLHGVNTFNPRQPESTYQHSINPIVNPNIIGAVSNENKNIHYEMLSKANPAILAKNHEQQNLMLSQQNNSNPPPPLDMEKVFEDYSKSIMDIIKSTFQINHWGYIPLDVVEGILNNCSKSYSYELIVDGENSFINISNATSTFSTEKFVIK